MKRNSSPLQREQRKKGFSPGRYSWIILCIFALLVGIYVVVKPHTTPPSHVPLQLQPQAHAIPTPRAYAQSPFLASIDTMKVSRDTVTHPFSTTQIKDVIQVSASLHTNYITVDTNWDYPDYMRKWITAIRAKGQHIWFRGHPDQWEDDHNAAGIMTPQSYLDTERAFILANASFFQPGDIFDACSEPEQGKYWFATYQQQWTYNAPNDATRAFNTFLRDSSDVADKAFQQAGINGVITNIRSTNAFFATHPDVLEATTVKKFGRITFDSYPEHDTTDAAVAVHARIEELTQIENIWRVPIIIGEMGYSNDLNVDDQTQLTVLKAELDALTQLAYIAGINYWVGPGSETAGGYTNIITQVNGDWSLRPAAYALASFYKAQCESHTVSPTVQHAC